MSAQLAPLTASAPRTLRLSTPARLRLALAAIVVLALLFFLAVYAGVKEHRAAMTTIGKDTAPSILAAQHIRANLADMHSNTANALLHKPGAGKEEQAAYQKVLDACEKRRIEATEGILAAAGNITYGEAERGPLRKLLNELGRYQACAAEALVLHRLGGSEFLEPQRRADRIMTEAILPAADALDAVNRKEMDRAYTDVRAASLRATVVVLGAAVGLLGVLALTQLFLYQRMHRILNPGLAAATVLTLVFTVVVVGTFLRQRAALRTATKDAFDSIHALWRARAEAYDGNGDESRWLLDRQRADAYERDFLLKEARLMKLPDGMSRQELVAAVRRGNIPKDFTGYLADELRNVTFPGEREAASACLETFVRYADIDREIRKLEKAGRHKEAVALCLGEREGQSNWAFDEFDRALGKTIDINQKVFDDTVKRSLDGLKPFDVTAALVALGVVALALGGLWPRFREYAAN
jgi:hypothetical protein